MEKESEVSSLNEIREAHLNAHDWQQEHMHFVPLEGSWFPQAEDGFDLDEEINKFLVSDKKVLLLLGNSGSGKSLYTQGLANRLWQSYDDQKPLPLWISLPSLKNPQINIVQEYLKSFGLTEIEIETLNKTRSFIFILDAYDEIRILKNLYVSNELAEWNAKMIVTCRREYLYTVDNYQQYFVPFRGEKAQYNEYTEIIVSPFKPNQIQGYLKNYIQHHETEWKDWQRYEKKMGSIPGLKNLIATPFMLKLAVEALPKIVLEYQQTEGHKHTLKQASLYDIFVEQWFIRQEQKLKDAKLIPENEDIKPVFWNYAKNIAQTMHEKNITQITYENNESDLFGEAENPWKPFFNSDDPRIALLQTACLIRKINASQYAFIHNSLLEYFLTRDLYETLLESKNDIFFSCKTVRNNALVNVEKQTVIINTNQPDYFNQRLLVKELNTIQFLADRVNEQSFFKKILFQKIEASKNNADVQISAANAITILNRAGVCFSQREWRGIHIKGADLSGAILDHTDLRNADLREVSLRGAWLNNAKLCHAMMQNVEFAELPSLTCGDSNQCIAWSSDLRHLVVGGGSGSEDNNSAILHLYKVDSWNLIGSFDGHEAVVQCVAFSLDSKFLLSGSEDKTVRLWEVESRKLLWVMEEHTDAVLSVAFNRDGKVFASGSKDKTICLWGVENRELLRRIVNEHECYCLAFNPYGEILTDAIGGGEAAYSSDGRMMLTYEYTYSKTLYLFEVGSRKCLSEIKQRNVVISFTFSSDNRLCACATLDGIVSLWELENWKLVCEIGVSYGYPNNLKFSPDGKILAGGVYNQIHLWKMQDLKFLEKTEVHSDLVKCIAMSSDGKMLASGSEDSSVRLWEVDSGRLLKMMKHIKGVMCVAFSPSGKLIASGDFDEAILMWEVGNKKPQLDLDDAIFLKGIEGDTGFVSSLAFSPNGKFLASGYSHERFVHLWKVKNKKLSQKLEGPEGSVCSLAFSPDGRILASGSADETIHLWEILWEMKTHKPLAVMKGHKDTVLSVAFSPDGKILASGSVDKTVRLWEVDKGKILRVLDHTNIICSVVFSADAEFFATGSIDGTVRLWSARTWECLASRQLEFPVSSLTFKKSGEDISLCVSNGKAIHHFAIRSVESKLTLVLLSNMGHLGLMSDQLDLDDVIGLSQENTRLLIQRGAICNHFALDSHLNAKSIETNLEDEELQAAIKQNSSMPSTGSIEINKTCNVIKKEDGTESVGSCYEVFGLLGRKSTINSSDEVTPKNEKNAVKKNESEESKESCGKK